MNNNLIDSSNQLKEDDNNKKKFICEFCETSYSSKQNLINHLKNKKLCDQKREYNNFMKEFNKIRLEKEINNNNNQKNNQINNNQINNQQINNQQINNNQINNNQNIFNSNNIQNHNNFTIKDFIKDNYDLTHIKDSYYKNKDFFLFNNFLEQVMLNEKNRNIYFNDDKAIFLNENELNKMSDEKAGLLVLQKLSKCMDILLLRQDEQSREYYSFIQNYYRIIQGQYKFDTLYKEYDIDDRKFVSIGSNNMFRARDRHLLKMKKVLEKHNNNIRKNLCNFSDNGEILTFEPNIEDFISKRARYRDLKSKD